MSTNPTPGRPTLKRRIAQSTRGARMAIARGVIGVLGLKMSPYEPVRAPVDLRPRPARVPPAAAPRPDRFTPERSDLLQVDACTVCGDSLATLVKDEYCPTCNTPGRTRSLKPLLDHVISPLVGGSAILDLPLLGFAMASVEVKLLKPVFPSLKSVSLFGAYGRDHELGVDARDLSRYPDNAFSGHFSILLFDYFTEQEQGIREAFRVIAPGGVFMTELGPYRLKDGWEAPFQVKEVRARPGYFEYLPEGVALADIRVGRQWFLQTMEDAGFQVRWIQVHDRATGKHLDWFVGVKPEAPRAQDSSVASA